MERQTVFAIERLLDLMTNPKIKMTDYCRKWEVSRRTFYRDKVYVRDRLYMYQVTRK